MILNFPLPADGKVHRYCISCFKEGAEQIKNNGITMYRCEACGVDNGRALYFNKHKVWLDSHQELWHESAGIYVRRDDGKFLFFQRNEFPLMLTVPSGHVDYGETPPEAAKRELAEETDIKGNPEIIGSMDVIGDSCSAGADVHKWHAFLLKVNDSGEETRIFDEGEIPLWLSLDEARSQGMTFVLERITDEFRELLEP